jgi:hypothetical protein
LYRWCFFQKKIQKITRGQNLVQNGLKLPSN